MRFSTFTCGKRQYSVPIWQKVSNKNLTPDVSKQIGARAAEVDPAVHDRIFYVTNSLLHLFAYCLRDIFEEISEPGVDRGLFGCPSLCSATRVAASEPEILFQMLWHDCENVKISPDIIIDGLLIARHRLHNQDREKSRKPFK